jgi:hypothetical protein
MRLPEAYRFVGERVEPAPNRFALLRFVVQALRGARHQDGLR